MTSLKLIVENSDTRLGRIFDLVIQALIVLSLVTFSIETLPNISPQGQKWIFWFECCTVVLFTFEYLTRVYVADDKWKFITSFFGIVDLLAVLPFYLSLGVDLRSLRAFRLLRLFRIFKLVRYSRAIRRFHRALLITKEEIVIFLSATSILLFLASVGIYQFENKAQPEVFASIFHSMWWAVVTLTTVGYGDAYPITLGGRTFTFFLLFIGLGIVAVPAGLFASALTKAREMELEEHSMKNDSTRKEDAHKQE